MSEAEATPQPWPVRRIEDSGPLRAMAHPLRLRLIELLGVYGPATATELAARVGESPANCSYHLRQLAANGFIEEADGGKGRQRIWRYVPEGQTFDNHDGDEEFNTAADMASIVMQEAAATELRAWMATRAQESTEWRTAAFSSHSVIWLTAEELTELAETLGELFAAKVQRHFHPETRPEGARPIRLYGMGIPARSIEPHEPTPSSAQTPEAPEPEPT